MEVEERFIAQKSRDGAEVLSAQTDRSSGTNGREESADRNDARVSSGPPGQQGAQLDAQSTSNAMGDLASN